MAVVLSVIGIGSKALAHIPGDINRDGKVDQADYNLLTAAFGSQPGDANWNSDADLNGDGRINALDFNIIATNFGQSEPAVLYITGVSSFGGEGIGCMPYWPGTMQHTPCYYEAQSIMSQLNK